MSSMMLNIDLAGRDVLIVGGGAVAARKMVALLAAGASVRLVASEVSPAMSLLTAESVPVRYGTYESSDIENAFLVIAATDDRAINRKIAEDARRHGALVTVVSAPRSGNVTFPAHLRRGELQIGVSTNGTCPGFSAMVRDIIAEHIGEGYAAALEQLAGEREKLLTEGGATSYNSEILRSRARELLHNLVTKERVP